MNFPDEDQFVDGSQRLLDEFQKNGMACGFYFFLSRRESPFAFGQNHRQHNTCTLF